VEEEMDLEYWETLLGEAIEEVEYRDIFIVAEVEDKTLAPVSLEIVGKARELADSLGAYVKCVLLGGDVKGSADELFLRGADTVYLAEDPALEEYNLDTYVKVLGDFFEQKKPEVVLLGATDIGRELAPRLAQRLGAPLFTNCVEIEIDASERLLLATYPVYGGDYFHVSASPSARPQIVTVSPGTFAIPEAFEYRAGEVESIPVELPEVEPRVKVLEEVTEEARGNVPLSEAKVIVSGGRGMGDEAGFSLLERLAGALKGVVAGSRGAVDEGWIGEERQVGMTGVRVRPDLYIACGISGAIHHYIGMQDARFVVAINDDEDAPIFKVADIGVVGDVREVIQALIEELEAEG
jgi:electron transfer flavoprotein alpha subunit